MNIYLIGLRGCGKTTVTPLLAELLDRSYLSTDQIVTDMRKKSIANIIASEGESGFRTHEKNALRKAASYPEIVVDTGGGIILAPENRKILRDTGVAVWLRCCIPYLWQRIQQDPRSAATRPTLSNTDALSELHQMERDRIALYATCSNFTLNTDRMSPVAVAEEIAAWYREIILGDEEVDETAVTEESANATAEENTAKAERNPPAN